MYNKFENDICLREKPLDSKVPVFNYGIERTRGVVVVVQM